MSSWDVKVNDGWSHTQPCSCSKCQHSYSVDRLCDKKMPKEYIDGLIYRSNPVRPRAWAPQGPDPKDAPFLPYGNWAGIVDGYIFKTGEKGMGYYKSC